MKKTVSFVLLFALFASLLSLGAMAADVDGTATGVVQDSGLYVVSKDDCVTVSTPASYQVKADGASVTYATSGDTAATDFYKDAESLTIDIADTDPSKQYLLIMQDSQGAPTEQNIKYVDQKAGASRELTGTVEAGTTFRAVVTMSGNPETKVDSLGAFELYVHYDPALVTATNAVALDGKSGKANATYNSSTAMSTWASDEGLSSVDEETSISVIQTEATLLSIYFRVNDDVSTTAESLFSSIYVVEEAEKGSTVGTDDETTGKTFFKTVGTSEKTEDMAYQSWTSESASGTTVLNLGLNLIATGTSANNKLSFTIYPDGWKSGNYHIYLADSTGTRGEVMQLTWYTPYIKGDVDDDKKVTASDALDVLKIVADIITPTKIQRLAADVDGEPGITASDALDILKYVADIIQNFK